MSLFTFENLRMDESGICPTGQTWVQPNCLVAPCPGFCSHGDVVPHDLPPPGFSSIQAELCPQDTLWDALTQSCQPATAEQLAAASRIPTSNPAIDNLVGLPDITKTPDVPVSSNSMDLPKLGALIIGAWLLFKYATRHNS